MKEKIERIGDELFEWLQLMMPFFLLGVLLFTFAMVALLIFLVITQII